jgi:predicted ATPase
MVIGCYRSNEVDDAHFLSKTIRDLHEKKENDGCRITDIYVGNLDVPSVNQIIIELLSVDSDDSSLDLAEICHRRTLGNAFHLMAFLSMLEEEGMLGFNLGLFQWIWKIGRIEEETAVAPNVVDLMKDKMNKQTGEVFNLLQLASCLGSSFDENILFVAWEGLGKTLHLSCCERSLKEDETVRTRDGLKQLLSQAIDEAFLEAHGESHFRWVHDKVQEAAMSLVAEGKMQEFQLNIGEILLSELSKTELRAAIFVVANLLNAKEVSDPDKKTKIIELNLDAAEKAKELSAFESAAKYVGKGIDLLPADRWTSMKELTLKMYSICAEAHYSLGNVAEMQKHCDEVLHQDNIPIFDKMRVYHCMLITMGNGGRAPEALKLSLDILSQLKCKLPRNSASQMVTAFYWLSKTKLPSKDEIAELPLMTDPTHKACMQLM